MKIEAIIFDVDGVLIDSVDKIIKNYQRTAKSLGLRVPSSEEVSRLFGKPLEKVVKVLWPNSDKDLYVKEFRRTYRDLKMPEIDGAVDTVKEIWDSGFKTGLISGKSRPYLEKHLREAGFNMDWFDVVVSFEETDKHKPDPEPILFACEKLNVKAKEVLFVGDSLFDFEAAKETGVNYVAVLTGCLNEGEVKGLGVENVIDSVSELPKFLEVNV